MTGIDAKEAHIALRELPMVIDHYMHSLLSKPVRQRVSLEKTTAPGDQSAE